MAIFQTIRNKLGPIIAIFIGLALGLFVLETALNSNTNLLKGNKDVVGVIDGNQIHRRDFDNKVDEAINNYKLQTNQANVDDNTMFTLRDQTWNQMITEQLNGSEYKKLGLVVSKEEMKDMFFGKDAVPEIKSAPFFTDPQTKQFDPSRVKAYYQHLDDPPREGEQPGERRQRWIAFEKGQKDQRMSSKYADLIKNALYVPKWEAETDYNEKNTRASVKFISVPYATILDSTIKVTDAELQDYINQHAVQFKQEESRKIDYVIFPVAPSQEDTAAVTKDINNIYSKLIASPDDTDIVKLNADNGLDKFYYKKEKIPSAYVKDTLFKLPLGTVMGPYFEDGNYKIVKLMDRKEISDSVKAHHILVRVEPNADSMPARHKIDSIYEAVKSGTPFDSLAKKFSDDQGSAQRGGDLGWYKQAMAVKNINSYLFFEHAAEGDMKVVRSEFGYHLIRIDSVRNVSPAVQVDFITRPLEASSETDKAAFDKATRFASDNNTMEKFEKAAEQQKLNKQSAPSVAKNANQLPGLQSARELVKWSYTAKLGDVSSPFSLESNYVVAVVTGVKKEGTASVEDVRPQAELLVRKQKKGREIAAQIAAALSLNPALDALAVKMNQPLKNADNITFGNSYADKLGYEPKVIGTIFSLKENQVSKPVTGEQGVDVLQLLSVTKPEPIADYNQFRQQLLSSLAPRLQYGLPDALKKAVKIEDNRYLFF
ncbi:MAG TPA: SurA N-terminal domain-containing protein [Chitinophagales bacterium]|nr:SurA N-terminal domain-containing protein [Chitinophagales bacterium]